MLLILNKELNNSLFEKVFLSIVVIINTLFVNKLFKALYSGFKSKANAVFFFILVIFKFCNLVIDFKAALSAGLIKS